MKIISLIENPAVSERILRHLKLWNQPSEPLGVLWNAEEPGGAGMPLLSFTSASSSTRLLSAGKSSPISVTRMACPKRRFMRR
jgi:hypothetical protein